MIDQSWRRWLAPLALALVVLATIVVLAQGGGGSAGGGSGSSAAKPGSGKPAYVRVRSGQVLSQIADKYGLSVRQLEDLNPNVVDPEELHPGDRLRVH